MNSVRNETRTFDVTQLIVDQPSPPMRSRIVINEGVDDDIIRMAWLGGKKYTTANGQTIYRDIKERYDEIQGTWIQMIGFFKEVV